MFFLKKKGIHEERKECVGKKKNFFFTEVKLSSDIWRLLQCFLMNILV